ncbi:UDP-sugar hydrolase [Aureibaculum marinum]|uniref:UDP-sugar hydrolase n=1 Tax=Aureibaculum marinum TaxID=2487930 RepID=A0A3N4N967_9FLAO|nr:5'-nucleotidase [Aureibaculum marinum]RPD90727.1 UDP-sugar hydrolase [Aureibaculum marinum]
MKLLHLFCFLLLVTSCKKTNPNITKITAKNIAIDSTIQSSVKIDSIVAPYKEKLIREMETTLTYTPKDLTKESIAMQTTLGNLMADLCFEMASPIYKKETNTSIDFSMFNYGGIRTTIASGKVTKGDAFKLMPFENELVVVTITGDKIEALINYFIESKTAHPLSKNIEFTLKENKYSLKINGKNFDNNATYNVLTSDFLQSGGDKMKFFQSPEKLVKFNYKVRDAIIDYFIKVDTLTAVIDNRVTIED